MKSGLGLRRSLSGFGQNGLCGSYSGPEFRFWEVEAFLCACSRSLADAPRWAHYQESRDTVKQAVAQTKMNLGGRWLEPGTAEKSAIRPPPDTVNGGPDLARIIREVIRTTVSGARWDTNPSSWDWSSERIAEFWYRNVELQDRETGVP